MDPAWANSTRARKSSSKGASRRIAESCEHSNIIVRIMNLWNVSVLRYNRGVEAVEVA
jgi:hypothetical protein